METSRGTKEGKGHRINCEHRRLIDFSAFVVADSSLVIFNASVEFLSDDFTNRFDSIVICSNGFTRVIIGQNEVVL